MSDDDLAARHAGLIARTERLLADWEQHPPCGDAVHEGVNLSEQLARLAVAYEDDRADEFAVTTAFNAGFTAGQRSAAQQQPSRKSTQDGAPVIRLLPPLPAGKPRRVPAAVIVAAAGKLAAGTASTAAAIPLPD